LWPLRVSFRVLVLNDASTHEHACIFADSAHHKTSEFAGSLYERAVREGRPIIIDDLAAWPDRTRIEDDLINNGVRNMVAAPLHYQDEVIGTLELASPNPGDLNATHLLKLEEVLPLFSVAVQRSVEGAEHAHPDPQQGEMHSDPPHGRVALPQGRAQRPRAGQRRHAQHGHRDGGARLRGRTSALRARRHPQVVGAAGPGHPGRP
jgi:GAF domain-containing protein